MSPTPRTDACRDRMTGTMTCLTYVSIDFARELEREVATAMDVLAQAKVWIDEAKPLLEQGGEAKRALHQVETKLNDALVENAALREDKARLDWMQESACEEGRTMAMPRYSYRVKQWEGMPGRNIRDAIDAARKLSVTP